MTTAILGAGILGTCTALELADRGHQVTLFEKNSEPLSEASLHNEGKLHLGFVYAADRSFRTADRMIHGAARFMDVLGRWMSSTDLLSLIARPFDYVVHRETMVSLNDIEAHFARVVRAVEHVVPRCTLGPFDPSRPLVERLSAAALAKRYDPALVLAAYETAEIAVDTWELAGHLRAAVRAHPRIALVTHARVITAEDRSGGGFDIVFDAGGRRREGPFEVVVNALWANRAAIDARYGLSRRGQWLNRQKLAVNVLCPRPVDALPSVTVMLGPYGDIVAYQSGRVYLSWYPVCMIGATNGVEETDWDAVLRTVDRRTIQRESLDALGRICPGVRALEAITADVVINGGTICAQGQTDIDDPDSQLHERLDSGIDGRGAYLSVDTSKFTLGPAAAMDTVDRVAALARAAF